MLADTFLNRMSSFAAALDVVNSFDRDTNEDIPGSDDWQLYVDYEDNDALCRLISRAIVTSGLNADSMILEREFKMLREIWLAGDFQGAFDTVYKNPAIGSSIDDLLTPEYTGPIRNRR